MCNNFFRIEFCLGYFKCIVDIDYIIKMEILYEIVVLNVDLGICMFFLRFILNILDSLIIEY